MEKPLLESEQGDELVDISLNSATDGEETYTEETKNRVSSHDSSSHESDYLTESSSDSEGNNNDECAKDTGNDDGSMECDLVEDEEKRLEIAQEEIKQDLAESLLQEWDASEAYYMAVFLSACIILSLFLWNSSQDSSVLGPSVLMGFSSLSILAWMFTDGHSKKAFETATKMLNNHKT